MAVTKWSSRKLAVACVCQATYTVLCSVAFAAYPDSREALLNTYTWLTGITVGGYFGGNVGEHLARR